MSPVIQGEVVEATAIVRAGDVAACRPIVPRVSVRVRAGTLADLAFIDRLQKAHSRELGFLPTAALEGKIERGEVLVAERIEPQSRRDVENRRREDGLNHDPSAASGEMTKSKEISPPNSAPQRLSGCISASPVGYLIASDRYQKRDEIGYIVQINVVPEFRRSLVAAALLQAQFDRSAYGCRLYCCWCAQDLTSANEFWEAMGFTAIAFRTGSRTKGKKTAGKRGPRIHIFWQKRVRADDAATPWWYPSTTGGGEIREDRLVFPIPPGVSWRDVLPVVLAGEKPEEVQKEPRAKTVKKVVRGPRIKGGLWFRKRAAVETVEEEDPIEKATDQVEPKPQIDPRLKKLARELRDRWSERADEITALPAKHDVRKLIAPELEPQKIAPPALPMPEAA